MNRAELQEVLEARGIRASAYDLSGRECDECYKLVLEPTGWVVYYAERGGRTAQRSFSSEDAACRDLADRVLNDAGAKRDFPHFKESG